MPYLFPTRLWRSRFTLVAVLVTAVAAVTAATSACAAPPPGHTYLFPYFRNNGETGVYLAASPDGKTFTALNNANPVFTPPNWPGQSLTRDPSISYRNGLFHMVWTSNWDGNILGYASSPNLRDWSAPKQVAPFPAAAEQPTHVWAPEIEWDPVQSNYMIIWSSTLVSERNDGDGSTTSGTYDARTYVTRTTDFNTFTPAQKLFDLNVNVIDPDPFYDDLGTPATSDDRWVFVLKNENNAGGSTNGKNLRIVTANRTLTSFSNMSGPIAGPGSSVAGTWQQQAEGPTLLKDGNTWMLYWDAFLNGHYSMGSSPDLATWTNLNNQMVYPSGARHGTIFTAPASAVAYIPEPTGAAAAGVALAVLACRRNRRRARSGAPSLVESGE